MRGFTIFFTGTSNGSETFCTVFLYKFFIFSNFGRILEYQRYGECLDYYRLSCLRHILFLMHCFARFDETIDSIGGIIHGEVILQ